MDKKTCPNDESELEQVQPTLWKCKQCEFKFEVLPADKPVVPHWHELGLNGTYSWNGQV